VAHQSRPARGVDAAKAKAEWAEANGFAWLSVQDHVIQTPIRIQQMEEAVRLILKLWTEPRTTFHGRYFHVRCRAVGPAQRPGPAAVSARSADHEV
jgi:Luciferase-like monooxygenase.